MSFQDEPPPPAQTLQQIAQAPEPVPATSRLPAVRASDAEREAVVSRLAQACGEGRLTFEELSNRTGTAYRAVTRGELEVLTVDLPEAAGLRATGPAAAAAAGAAAAVAPAATGRKKRKRIVCVMGEHKTKGQWRLADHTSVVTVMGEVRLDLRSAIIEQREIHLRSTVVMGEQVIIVPRGVEVEVEGFIFMGSKKVNVEETPIRPGTPRVIVHVWGTMGELRVETR